MELLLLMVTLLSIADNGKIGDVDGSASVLFLISCGSCKLGRDGAVFFD